jgi:hypothetical protein
MLFGFTTEWRSASDRNRVHLRPDSPSNGSSSPKEKTNVKETNQPTSSDATRNKQPQQLLELAGLEITRREILKDLANVEREMYRLNREVRVLGIEITWLARG